MNVPAFIDIGVDEQASELRRYFHKLGASISESSSGSSFENELSEIIDVCDKVFEKEDEMVGPKEIEELFNGIVSMLAVVQGDMSEKLILKFCSKLSLAPSVPVALACVKVLYALYQSLPESSPLRIHVYYHLLDLASKTDQIELIFKDVETFKQQFLASDPNVESDQVQKLLQKLHEVLLASKRSEDASKVMILLLGTYTTENASQAREEAQRCIVASLSDPNTFLLDHLLQLKPVKFLEGELIHDLLKIFVSERLEVYQKFYEAHGSFVDETLGLSHEANVRKMKLLTFMQMAEIKSQLSFGEIQQHIQLNEDEVEEFLIEVLKTKLVRAKLDQAHKCVNVSATMHRTFTTQHWHQLHQLLTSWRSNLKVMREQIGQLASAQVDLIDNELKRNI